MSHVKAIVNKSKKAFTCDGRVTTCELNTAVFVSCVNTWKHMLIYRKMCARVSGMWTQQDMFLSHVFLHERWGLRFHICSTSEDMFIPCDHMWIYLTNFSHVRCVWTQKLIVPAPPYLNEMFTCAVHLDISSHNHNDPRVHAWKQQWRFNKDNDNNDQILKNKNKDHGQAYF